MPAVEILHLLLTRTGNVKHTMTPKKDTCTSTCTHRRRCAACKTSGMEQSQRNERACRDLQDGALPGRHVHAAPRCTSRPARPRPAPTSPTAPRLHAACPTLLPIVITRVTGGSKGLLLAAKETQPAGASTPRSKLEPLLQRMQGGRRTMTASHHAQPTLWSALPLTGLHKAAHNVWVHAAPPRARWVMQQHESFQGHVLCHLSRGPARPRR